MKPTENMGQLVDILVSSQEKPDLRARCKYVTGQRHKKKEVEVDNLIQELKSTFNNISHQFMRIALKLPLFQFWKLQ